MPPVVAAIVAAVQAITWTQVIMAVVSTAISIATSALSKPKRQEQRGAQIDYSIDPAAPRVAVFGTTRIAGSLVDAWCAGTDNKWDVEVWALAEGQNSAILNFWIGDNYYPFSGDGPQSAFTVGGVDHLWIYHRLGTDTQTSHHLSHPALSPHWTADHRGIGVCYVIVIRLYNEKVFPSNEKPDGWKLQGLLNPCLSGTNAEGGSGPVVWGNPATYLYTDSALEHAYHYLRGVWVNGQLVIGPGLTTAELPSARWLPEIAICGEQVPLKAGGTEYRYLTCAAVASDDDWTEVADEFARSVAGSRIDIGGQQVIMCGVARVPAVTLTEQDFDARANFRVQDKKPGRDVKNTVSGRFTDHVLGFISGDYPAKIDAVALASAGGKPRERVLNLPFVYRHTQAQRIALIALNLEQLQTRCAGTLQAWVQGFEAGDWADLSMARYGWSSLYFTATRSSVGPTRKNAVELQLTSAAAYAWNPATDEADHDAATPTGTALPGPALISGFGVSTVSVVGAGMAQRPALRVVWSAPTDPSIRQIRVEFRRVGDATILEHTVLDPSKAADTIVEGIQAGTAYEARATPVPEPLRAATTTAWSAGVTTGSMVLIESQGINRHPLFDAWPDGQALPTSFTLSNAANVAFTKDTSEKIYGQWAGVIDFLNTSDAWIIATASSELRAAAPGTDLLTVEYDIETDTAGADFQRFGSEVRVLRPDTSNYDSYVVAFHTQHPTVADGQRYKKTLTLAKRAAVGLPTGNPTGSILYLRGNNATLFSGATSAAKRIKVHKLLWREPSVEERRSFVGLTAEGASRRLDAGALANQPNGDAFAVPSGLQRGTVQDGIAVVFDTPYAGVPVIRINGGKTYDASLAGAQIVEDSIVASTTGFTAALKLKQTVGSVTNRTANFSGTSTSQDADKPFAADAWNNQYKVTGSIVIAGFSEVPGEGYSGAVDVVVYVNGTSTSGAWAERQRKRVSMAGTMPSATKSYTIDFSAGALGLHGGKEFRVAIVPVIGSATFSGTQTVRYDEASTPVVASRTSAEQPCNWEAMAA